MEVGWGLAMGLSPQVYLWNRGAILFSQDSKLTLTAAYAQSSPVSGLHGCLQFSGLSPVLAGKDSVARPGLERPAPHSSLPQTFVRHLLQGWQ